MNTEMMLKVWMTENVSVVSMAQLFDQDVVAIENSLRQALLRVRDEGLAEKSGGSKPVDTEQIKRGPRREKTLAGNGHKLATFTPGQQAIADEMIAKAKTAPVRLVMKQPSGAVMDISEYPEALQHPLATMQRALWDALAGGPMAFSALCVSAGLDPSNGNPYGALTSMRNKLLVHKRDGDGMWERTVRE
jgi:hypothetical protein